MPQLRDFQREDVEAIKKQCLRALIASSPGTGKTPIAITSLVETGRWSLPALIIAPASVTHNWKKEISSWAPGFRVQVIEDMSSPIEDDKEIYIISWSLLDPREMELHGLHLKSVVADECHLAKNPDALRSQSLYRLTRRTNGLLLLTGTPIVNTKEELQVLESLFLKKPLLIRRLLEDVAPDVPEKTRSYLYVKLRDRAQAEYDHAVEDFEAWLRKEKERLLGEGLAEAAVERAMAAEAFTKMGYLRRLIGVAKIPAASDWIARAVRIGEPVVVFVEHQAVLSGLSKALRKQRIRHCVIEGKTAPKKRARYIEEFQANHYPVILCTKAGKEGITLHAARHLLFVERFFTCADEEQAEDRIRRIGQKFPTTIWYLHATGTIDDRLDAIVRGKRQLVREVLRTEDTQESDNGNVVELIRGWSHFVAPKVQKVSSLGRGDPLPPLPYPGETHVILFKGARWNPHAAHQWCLMHGYQVQKLVQEEEQVRAQIHPIDVFRPKAFSSEAICKDVKLILGTRLSAYNEKQVRQRLHQIGQGRKNVAVPVDTRKGGG